MMFPQLFFGKELSPDRKSVLQARGNVLYVCQPGGYHLFFGGVIARLERGEFVALWWDGPDKPVALISKDARVEHKPWGSPIRLVRQAGGDHSAASRPR